MRWARQIRRQGSPAAGRGRLGPARTSAASAGRHWPSWPQVDRETGFRTRTILCLPVRSGEGRVFAVAQLLNRCDGNPFDEADEARFRDFANSIGVILETWWRMQHRRTDT